MPQHPDSARHDAAPPTGRTGTLLNAGLLILALAVFAYHARVYWLWTEDDAYISLRYAQNWVAGHGLVFNVGERVEGFSNFAWVMLAAASLRSGIEPLTTLKIVGLLSGLGCLVLSWVLARRLVPGIGMFALLAPWYLAVSPVLVQHAIAGLETAFFAFLVVATVLVAAAARPGVASRALLVVLLLLLSLSRPEGAGIAGIALFVRLVLSTSFARGASGALRGSVAEAIVWAVLFGAWYVWRWSYFGAPFANTFYAKAQGGLHGIVDGVQYTLDFMRDGGGVLFMGMAVAPVILGRAGRITWLTLAIVLSYVVFVVVSGGDWMYNYRFYAHVLPLVAALVAAGLEVVLGLVPAGSGRALALYAATALLLLATFVGIGNTELKTARIVLPALSEHNYLSQNYEELGLWLKENTDPDDTIAVSDVGAIGYFSERRVLDMFGLIDRHIASLRGRMHYKADPRYVLSREPDYIVLVSLNDQGGGYSFQRIPDYAMNARPEFHQQYELVRTVPQHWNNEYVLVYRRNDQTTATQGAPR